ncbi:MAG: DUF1566 domain-containing protein [Rikenellaceae bacterium]
MKKSLILLLLCGCGTLSAANYKIVDTNQSLCFDNQNIIKAPKKGASFYGQDAQHQGNAPSYTDNGDGTITDNVTGLVWEKDFKIMSYKDALEAAEKFKLAGKKDWRVPTIKEAFSLILFSGQDVSPGVSSDGQVNGTPFVDTNFFGFKYGANGSRAIDSQLLSSTVYVGSSGRLQLVFGVNLADGRIKGYGMGAPGGRGGDKQFMVRFVRGESYGENEFKDNGDGTISDVATSLMWSKKDSGEGMNWEKALEYTQKMNKEKYLGYNDWRVPNAKELQSIVDYTRSPLSTQSAAIDPIFEISTIKDESGADDYPFFWSSTTHQNSAARAAGSAGCYVTFGRSLGNMSNMQQMGQGQGQRGQGQNRQGGQGQGMGQNQNQRQNRQGGQGGQASQGRQGGQNSGTPNWVDIHGAGAQRSDPKAGDASKFKNGRGPQGDAIRIDNYVRLVRDL